MSTKRADILTGAEALFAERGFGAPSLRDVLAAAKVSTTAFYARFPGKAEVLEALVHDLLAELQQTAGAVVAEAEDLDDGFRRGLDALLVVLGRRKGLVGVALTEGMSLPAVREAIGTTWTELVSLLAAGLAAQGHDDAEARAWALVGALNLQVTRWAVMAELSDDELRASLREVAGVLRG